MKVFQLKNLFPAVCLVALFALGTTYVHAEDNGVLKGPDAKPEKRAGKGGMNGERKGLGRGGNPLEHLLKGIELTDDQKTKVETIKTESRDKAKAFFEANKKAIEALRAETKTAHEAKDKEAMKSIREKRKALFADAPKPENVATQIRTVLTDDQQKTLDANLAEMKKKRDERMKKAGKGERPERGERKQRGKKGGDTGGEDKIDM